MAAISGISADSGVTPYRIGARASFCVQSSPAVTSVRARVCVCVFVCMRAPVCSRERFDPGTAIMHGYGLDVGSLNGRLKKTKQLKRSLVL